MRAEIDALVRVIDDLMTAADQIAVARQEFEALPPTTSLSEAQTRIRLRAALLENHLCMLMTRITRYAVMKKFAARDFGR